MFCRWIFSFFILSLAVSAEEITPHKFTDKGLPEYTIPSSSRYTCPRLDEAPEIVYYFSSPPEKGSFPIAILCEGSSSSGHLYSVIHIHRYFLQELWDLGLGVLTVEKWGIDGDKIDEQVFFDHYTRGQRRQDHLAVIEHLQKNPPQGWNGQFVLIGVSEGGPLVTELTTLCPNIIATVNWSGTGDWSWRDELWNFAMDLKQKSWLVWAYDLVPRWLPFSWDLPPTGLEYDDLIERIIHNPTSKEWMMGMTYLYHADAFLTPPIDYTKLQSPFLVVTGTEDSIIESSDLFVKKAEEAGAPISYLRVEGMDHYVRRRPDILQESFAWLQKQINKAPPY